MRSVWLEQSKRGGEREEVGSGKGHRQVIQQIKGRDISAVITKMVTKVHSFFPIHLVAEAVGWPPVFIPYFLL